MRIVTAAVCTTILLVWAVVRIVSWINLDRYCIGYLKRAADANTVSLAHANLTTAIVYAQEHGLTSGYTSILYRTPDEDVGFWYGNLLEASGELGAITDQTTQLERTNVLMKLRETLLDQGDEGVSVTAPPGLSVYPHNRFLFWLALIALIGAAVPVLSILMEV